MKIDGTDIADCWALTPADHVLVMAKSGANRVDFALLLLFYRAHGRFPNEPEGASTCDAMQDQIQRKKLGLAARIRPILVGAQTGFLDGPAVHSNMASDYREPRHFRDL